jgi:hypothetical protein
MFDALRRVADELDPDYVPDWALVARRPVPGFARRLLSIFGRWWLPRLGLGLVVGGIFIEVAAFLVLAGRAWMAGILMLAGGLLTAVAGSVMWTAYRMRHWLPDGRAAGVPLARPVPASVWAWTCLALVLTVGGVGLMMWLIVANGSARGIVVGVGLFTVCAGSAAALLLWMADSVSTGGIRYRGWSARRLSRAIFVVGLVLGAILMAQAPLLPATRLHT